MGSINIKSGGLWRASKSINVKSAGTWRTAKEVWVRSGGVWQKAWTNGPTFSISGSVSSESAGGVGNMNDVANLTLNWTGAVAPTSYNWWWTGSYAWVSGGTSRTPSFRGPGYNMFEMTMTDYGEAVCQVVLGGATYIVSTDLSFTVPGDR